MFVDSLAGMGVGGASLFVIWFVRLDHRLGKLEDALLDHEPGKAAVPSSQPK
jgi:hypothetical protein